jgi:hypothetical protein
MKKSVVFVMLMVGIVISSVSAQAYTVYVGIDDTFAPADLAFIDGFQFDLSSGGNITDLTLGIRHQAEGDVDSLGTGGAIPDEFDFMRMHFVPWDVFKTTNGVSGANEMGLDLTAGIIVNLTGASPFALENFLLFSDETQSGFYPGVYAVKQLSLGDAGQIYTYTAAPVPLPGAVLLLGSGLLGLVGLRRKSRK